MDTLANSNNKNPPKQTCEKYETTDLGLAASLSAAGFRALSVNKPTGSKATFVFENSAELQGCVADYWSEKLILPAIVLFENFRLMKARLYGTV